MSDFQSFQQIFGPRKSGAACTRYSGMFHHYTTTNQVRDTSEADELIHDKVIQTTGRCWKE